MYNIKANTLFTGKPLIYLPTCHSTNDVAAQLLTTTAVTEGTVIITSGQTAGKGQRGNSWETEPGKNLTFSLVLKPVFLHPGIQFRLNICISLAVSDFLTKYLGEKVKIKWPNDLFYENKKICGMLMQNHLKKNQIESSVVGIGINVNQEVFKEKKAASLKKITGKEFNCESLLPELLECLEGRYLQLRNGNYEQLKEKYLQTLLGYSVIHTFRANNITFQGVIKGIDETGKLMVEKQEGIKLYDFKEIEFLF